MMRRHDSALLPFLKWAGGKRWLWQRHPELFKLDGRRHVEPFLGGAAVFFALRPKAAVLSDLNTDLMQTYRAIRADWKKVWSRLRYHQKRHLEQDGYYYLVRGRTPTSDIGRAARFIYLNRTCFNGLYRVNLNGIFNVPKGTKDMVIFEHDNFEEVAYRLSRARLQVSDFESVINAAGEGDFLFVDPPYTVKHNFNGFLKYNERIFSWQDQERLADAVRRFALRGGRALVTNAAHHSVINLYEDLGEVHHTSRHSVLASDTARRTAVEEIAVTVGYSVTLEAQLPAVRIGETGRATPA
jgi:DNA adenine methylase